jgi:BASS family bile acid:Na+ symporter
MHTWLNVFAATFTALMMFSAATATSKREIRRVSGERKLLARAFLANVVVVPTLAIALLHALHLYGDLATGAVLAAICPGAPFGTFLAARTRGDVALAVILTCALTVVALVTTPITSWLIFGPEKMVALPRGLGLLVTALIVLLPAVLGQALRRRSAPVAVRLAKTAGFLAFLALIAANVAAGGLRSSGVRAIGGQGSALILALVVVSMGVGWLAGRSPGTRATLATSTGLRNVGLAFLFAEYKSPGTQVVLGVAAYSVLMLVPNFAFAAMMRRRQARADAGSPQ